MRLIGRVVENQLLTAALVVVVIVIAVAVAGDGCADVVIVADVLAIDAQWSIGPSRGEKIPKIILRFSEIFFAFFRL